MGDRAGEGSTLNNIGAVYRNQGNYDEALRFFTDALAISQQVGDRAGEGSTLWNIGTTYAKQRQFDLALANLQQAFIVVRSVGIPPYEEGITNWILDVLEDVRQEGDQTEYQRQCQQTAAATGVAVAEWCP